MPSSDAITEGLKLIEEAQKATSAEAVKNDTATEDQKESVQYAICPCCGKPTLIKPVEIKGALLDQFMACLATNVPFSHTYPIYNGRLEVTVQQLTKQLATSVAKATSALDLCSRKAPEQDTLIHELKRMIQLYCCISSITIKTGAENKSYQPADAIKVVCDALGDAKLSLVTDEISKEEAAALVNKQYAIATSPDVISTVPIIMLAGLAETHTQLYNILLDAGFDSNFWKGIELA